jgi:hypothetical protein
MQLGGPSVPRRCREVRMHRISMVMLVALIVCLIPIAGCQDLVIEGQAVLARRSIRDSRLPGTTFAAVPDLLAMLRRKSSEGMNPRMGAIMGAFQVLWVYYGLLIGSRLVILWNVIAVLINLGTVGAFAYYLHREREAQPGAAK